MTASVSTRPLAATRTAAILASTASATSATTRMLLQRVLRRNPAAPRLVVAYSATYLESTATASSTSAEDRATTASASTLLETFSRTAATRDTSASTICAK
ncbi:hypothetical protein KRP22_006386 [Phytophthora ramorum]